MNVNGFSSAFFGCWVQKTQKVIGSRKARRRNRMIRNKEIRGKSK